MVAEVLGIIDRDFASRLSLAVIAREVRRSPSHLTDRVRRVTGLTVSQWIIERRLAEARGLLSGTDLPVAEVAGRVGYVDVRHFTRHFGREDIGLVIHTHLHMDHAGQDILLPAARIHVRRGELRNAAAPNLYPVPFYDRLNVARLVHDLFDRVEVADGDETVLSGIRTRHMPGHTPGHQVVEVDTDDGLVVICGDAAMDLEKNVRHGVPPGFLDSMADTMTGLRTLASLDADGAHVLAAHDAEVFTRYPHGVGT